MCLQLACKSEREYRAVELCEMMPSAHTVQLAIKYASRLRLINLAERLSQLAQSKAVQEEQGADEVEEDEEDVVEVIQHRLYICNIFGLDL